MASGYLVHLAEEAVGAGEAGDSAAGGQLLAGANLAAVLTQLEAVGAVELAHHGGAGGLHGHGHGEGLDGLLGPLPAAEVGELELEAVVQGEHVGGEVEVVGPAAAGELGLLGNILLLLQGEAPAGGQQTPAVPGAGVAVQLHVDGVADLDGHGLAVHGLVDDDDLCLGSITDIDLVGAAVVQLGAEIVAAAVACLVLDRPAAGAVAGQVRVKKAVGLISHGIPFNLLGGALVLLGGRATRAQHDRNRDNPYLPCHYSSPRCSEFIEHLDSRKRDGVTCLDSARFPLCCFYRPSVCKGCAVLVVL